MNSVAFAVIVLVVLGLAGGIILVLASKFMAVYEDPRIAQITECLAGANCGGCGYAGCADYAKAIVENGAPTNKCAPGGAKATEAVNQGISSFCRFITANDVGSTGSHQSGFYIPKHAWPLLFDAPGVRGENKSLLSAHPDQMERRLSHRHQGHLLWCPVTQ